MTQQQRSSRRITAIQPDTADVTGLLLAWGTGDEAALERLVPLVHGELRRIARRCMAGERAGHSLQATALVNEAYLRLVDVAARATGRTARTSWRCRRASCGASSWITRARRGTRSAAAGRCKVTFDEGLPVAGGRGSGSGGARRCAGGAGEGRRAQEPGRRAAILRRPERRGDSRGAEGVARDGHARLEVGEGVAACARCSGGALDDT